MYRWGCILLLLVVAIVGPALAQAPNVPENSVVNGASFIPFGQPGHANAPGSIVAIFGTNFASSLSQSMTIPLSSSLGGVSVTFNNIQAPLFFVSAGQIGAQVPFGVSGSTASIVVSNSAGSSTPRNIQIAPTSPAIFTVNAQGTGQGVVVFATEPNVFAAVPSVFAGPNPPPARPARAGDFLTIYANGLGAVTPSVADGNAAPGAEPLARTAEPEVRLGGVRCSVLFSGLVPGLVALYQVNVKVPEGVATGNAVSLQISLGGVTSSDKVTIAVQ